MKNLRSIPFDYFKDSNLLKLRGFLERLNEKEFSDIFLGIRKNQLTLYYKGFELLNFKFIEPKNNELVSVDDVKIYFRKDFTNNDSLNEMIEETIDTARVRRGTNDNIGYLRELLVSLKKDKYICISDLKGFSHKDLFTDLLRGLMHTLDKRFDCDKERQIQNLYATKYNFKNKANKDKYIVDMELTFPKEFGDINGRFDMLALIQDSDTKKYKLTFIELKSKREAFKDKKGITGKTSGINGHIDDMDNFLYQYLQNEELKNNFKEYVISVLNIKSSLKLIDDFPIDMIDFDHPEAWILFDMALGEDKIINISSIGMDDIHTMKKSHCEIKFYYGEQGTFCDILK